MPREPDEAAVAARRSLEEAQTRLLAALVAGAEPPEGFDGDRVRLQARSLIAKRRGSVARAVPGLVAALGDAFAGEFAAYAHGRPKPSGGSRADARAFTEWLEENGRLPEPRPADQRERGRPKPGWGWLGRRSGSWSDRWNPTATS